MPGGRRARPRWPPINVGGRLEHLPGEARGLLPWPLTEEARMLLRVLRYAVLLVVLTARERLVRAVKRP